MRTFITAVLFTVIASACTPMEVVYWYGLHGLPMPPDPVALSTQIVPPAGWVNLGHGIWGPTVILDVRWCESRDDYEAQNSISTASGGFQYLTSTWVGSGYDKRYNAPTAADAYPWQQDEAAVDTYQHSGLRPWNSSASCWQP